MSKDDDPLVKRFIDFFKDSPQDDDMKKPGSHQEFFLKIQHVYGQKMIDAPQNDRPGSHHLEFFLTDQDLNMCMVKRWLTPSVWQTRISPRIFF